MNVNVLFVDDMPERLKRFRAICRDAGIQPAIQWRPTVAAVQDDDIDRADVAFLDRDLCVAGDVDPCPGAPPPYRTGCTCPTGEDLVARILARPAREGQRFVVHSANPGGGARMAQALKDAGRPVVYLPIMHWHGVVPTGLCRAWGLIP